MRRRGIKKGPRETGGISELGHTSLRIRRQVVQACWNVHPVLITERLDNSLDGQEGRHILSKTA